MKRLILGGALLMGLAIGQPEVKAESVTFSFDGGPLLSSTPLDQTSGGITAHFSSSATAYSIQQAGVLGFTPVGFSGYCLYPNSVFLSDLLISFDRSLKDISIMYAPEEYATDSSCTMRITAKMGSSYVGTNTNVIDPPGTWPTGTLSFTSTQAFDNVVIHYDQPPITGGDYGPVFMADNLVVTPVPEPSTTVGLIGMALMGLALSWRRWRMKK